MHSHSHSLDGIFWRRWNQCRLSRWIREAQGDEPSVNEALAGLNSVYGAQYPWIINKKVDDETKCNRLVLYLCKRYGQSRYYLTICALKKNEKILEIQETVTKCFATDMGQYGSAGARVKIASFGFVTGGTLVYFGVEDCSTERSRVSNAGGKVIRSKMSIGEFGWLSVCIDSEESLFGLSSTK